MELVVLYILVLSTDYITTFLMIESYADSIIVLDISPQNVLMEIREEQLNLKNIEDEESQNPSVPIMSNGTPTYRSRTPEFRLSGNPILTDFGQMRLAEPGNQDWWMSDLYRAPEVLLKLPWGFPVDIWSIGVMVRSLS